MKLNNLRDSIKKKNTILFVGSGVSATLKLPTWDELISHLANELGYGKELFTHYGDNLELAEYYVLNNNNNLGKLRRWMDQNWNVSEEMIQKSKIYETIVNLGFPIIYTTNYDQCLEKAMEHWNQAYKTIINVDDLVELHPSVTQIIKFHGDTSNDGSIVLTESSYFKRLDFESPLDIKLRADMLNKSVLFIGYSLSDINMRLLIYKLDQLWKCSNQSRRPQSYIFLANPNPIQEAILSNRGIQPIIGNNTDPTASLEQFLTSLLPD